MAAQALQSYKNHTRLDPLFHFFVLPIAAINVLVAIWNLLHNPGLGAGWFVVLALAGVVAVVKIRTYPLKAQDRLIRLEERLRLSELLSDPVRSKIGDLTEGQLVALRFAADEEVAEMVSKALGGMTPREIKKVISVWRADYFRV